MSIQHDATCCPWPYQSCSCYPEPQENPMSDTITVHEAFPILKFFRYDHLPTRLQTVSRPFCALAAFIVADLPNGPERAVALRKLLESKDAAVRAALEES